MKYYYGTGLLSGILFMCIFAALGSFFIYGGVNTKSPILFIMGIMLLFLFFISAFEFKKWYSIVPQKYLSCSNINIMSQGGHWRISDVVAVRYARKRITKRLNFSFSGVDHMAVIEMTFLNGDRLLFRAGQGPLSPTANLLQEEVGKGDVEELMGKLKLICMISRVNPKFVEYHKLVR